MGNKNDTHVRILETVPGLGWAIAVAHQYAGHREQGERAFYVCSLVTCTNIYVSWVAQYVFRLG